MLLHKLLEGRASSGECGAADVTDEALTSAPELSLLWCMLELVSRVTSSPRGESRPSARQALTPRGPPFDGPHPGFRARP